MNFSSLFIGKALVLFIALAGFFSFYITRAYFKEEADCVGAINSKYSCFSDLVKLALSKGDLDAAIGIVRSNAQTDADFAKFCHALAHQVGEGVFDFYLENKDFHVGSDVSFCNWGLIHGFIEKSNVSQGSLESAVIDFCNKLADGGVLSKKGVNYACFHGVGHGVANNHDPDNWGKPQRFVDSALKMCDTLTQNKSERSMCAYGVFMGIYDFMVLEEYGLSVNKSDPLWLCRFQEERYLDACYSQSYGVLNNVSDGDFSKILSIIKTIPHPYDEDTIRIAVAASHDPEASVIQSVSRCRALESRLSLSCIKGVAQYYMDSGTPGTEYLAANSFCRAHELTSVEKDACYDLLFSEVKIKYSDEKLKDVCSVVDREYFKLYCGV
jgi:hypothetical protein